MGAGSLSYISIIVFAVALSTGSVFAVDHGASCCGDLEERIAELEATTATKGNRKMSLTISGQVNRLIMWWDDGRSSNTYYGIESTPFSSRFDFTGKARITPKVNAGFQLTIDSRAGGYSGGLSQLDEDGKFSALVPNVNTGSTGPIGLPSFNAPDSGSYFANGRRIFWWIEQEDIGRLSVGRTDLPGLFATIDMTGGQLYLVAGDPSFINGSFYIRGPAGQYYAMVWGFIIDAAQGFNRTELVRYDSPTWHGFIYSAGVAEAGNYWGTMVRYAGEHAGFRVAAQIGYERITDVASPGVIDPANVAYVGNPPNIREAGANLSVLHKSTGLFAQGSFGISRFGGSIIGAPSGYDNQFSVNRKDSSIRLVQAGLSKNWFGPGITSVYGEYWITDDVGADITGATGTSVGRDFAASANTTGFTAVRGVTATEFRAWGIGIAQDLDVAASTTIYAGYRHLESSIRCTDLMTAATCSGGVSPKAVPGTFTTHKLATEPLDVIITGARVRF